MIYNTNTNPYSCVCDVNAGYTQAGNVCLLTSDISQYNLIVNSANQITYNSVETANKINNIVAISS